MKNGLQQPVFLKWIRKARLPTVLIISHARMQEWPLSDGKCVIQLKELWSMTQWNDGIRSGRLSTQFNKIVVYLKQLCNVPVPFLVQNAILALCRSIRAQNPECQLYFSNLLPRFGPVPVLSPSVKQSNQELFECRDMYR